MIKVNKDAKRIKFIQNGITYDGEYIGKKRYGNMAGMSKGKTYFKVKVMFNEIEFSTFRVEQEEIIEVLGGE